MTEGVVLGGCRRETSSSDDSILFLGPDLATLVLALQTAEPGISGLPVRMFHSKKDLTPSKSNEVVFAIKTKGLVPSY